MRRELIVHTRSHDYPIFIGENLIETFDFADYIGGKQVLVVTNETVAPLYLDKLVARLPADKLIKTCMVSNIKPSKALTVFMIS